MHDVYVPSSYVFNLEGPVNFILITIDRNSIDTMQGNTTGEWFLVYEINMVIGYWAKSILPNLVSGADTIRWGGAFTPSSNDTRSQMGSGQFRNGQRQITCYMRQVTYDETITRDTISMIWIHILGLWFLVRR